MAAMTGPDTSDACRQRGPGNGGFALVRGKRPVAAELFEPLLPFLLLCDAAPDSAGDLGPSIKEAV